MNTRYKKVSIGASSRVPADTSIVKLVPATTIKRVVAKQLMMIETVSSKACSALASY